MQSVRMETEMTDRRLCVEVQLRAVLPVRGSVPSLGLSLRSDWGSWEGTCKPAAPPASSETRSSGRLWDTDLVTGQLSTSQSASPAHSLIYSPSEKTRSTLKP